MASLLLQKLSVCISDKNRVGLQLARPNTLHTEQNALKAASWGIAARSYQSMPTPDQWPAAIRSYYFGRQALNEFWLTEVNGKM